MDEIKGVNCDETEKILIFSHASCLMAVLGENIHVHSNVKTAFLEGNDVLPKNSAKLLFTVLSKGLEWFFALFKRFLVDRGHHAPGARLDHRQFDVSHPDSVPPVFSKGLTALDDHIRSEAIHRDRMLQM